MCQLPCALAVRVSAVGAMSLTLAEHGTKNVVDRDGHSVRVIPPS
jgi:hypothetical protein